MVLEMKDDPTCNVHIHVFYFQREIFNTQYITLHADIIKDLFELDKVFYSHIFQYFFLYFSFNNFTYLDVCSN